MAETSNDPYDISISQATNTQGYRTNVPAQSQGAQQTRGPYEQTQTTRNDASMRVPPGDGWGEFTREMPEEV